MCQASNNCKIEIDFQNNPMKVFYSGQVMRGTVQLNLSKQKKVRRIYMHLYGGAYVSWSEYVWFDFGLHNWYSDHRKTYSGKEIHLNDGQYFVGAPKDDASCKEKQTPKRWQRVFKMAPGIHDYTFEFKLSSYLPTSIEGKHGHIRYFAIFVIDAIYPEKKKILNIPFTIIKPYDLNIDPEFRNPMIAEKTAKYPMKIVVRLPVRAYCPGQMINVEIDVNNDTDKSIRNFSAELIREIIYHKYANSKRFKLERTSMIKTKTEGCQRYDNKTILANIPIPPIPPTDLSTSNIIKVRYCVRIVGSVESVFHGNSILEFPITIGTYPIQDDSSALSNHINDATTVNTSLNNESVIITYDDLIKNPLYFEEMLPVYGAVFNKVRPRYLMFKYETSYSTRH